MQSCVIICNQGRINNSLDIKYASRCTDCKCTLLDILDVGFCKNCDKHLCENCCKKYVLCYCVSGPYCYRCAPIPKYICNVCEEYICMECELNCESVKTGFYCANCLNKK